MTIQPILRSMSYSLKPSDIVFLKKMKGHGVTYDLAVNMLINECGHMIDRVGDEIHESLQIFTIKISDETKLLLDNLAKEYRINRSEALRRLIQARVEGLC